MSKRESNNIFNKMEKLIQNMVIARSKIVSVVQLVYIISIFIRKKLRLVFKLTLGLGVRFSGSLIGWYRDVYRPSIRIILKTLSKLPHNLTHLLGDKEADKFMDLIESWNENKPFVEASNACTRWKNVNEDKKVNDRLVEDRIQNCQKSP